MLIARSQVVTRALKDEGHELEREVQVALELEKTKRRVACLRQLFSGIGGVDQRLLLDIEHGRATLPGYAESWFAIPNWRKAPGLFGHSYGEALGVMLDRLWQAHPGSYNFRADRLGSQHLRPSDLSTMFWEELAEAQGDPGIFLVPAGFGLGGPGGRCNRTRDRLVENEQALGAFAVGAMLLTDPKEVIFFSERWIECAGDEAAPDAGGPLSWTPYFAFCCLEIRFGANVPSSAGERYGIASAFLPQR